MTAYCPPVDQTFLDRTMGFQLPEGARAVLQNLRTTVFWERTEVVAVHPVPASMTEVTLLDMSMNIEHLTPAEYVVLDDPDLW